MMLEEKNKLAAALCSPSSKIIENYFKEERMLGQMSHGWMMNFSIWFLELARNYTVILNSHFQFIYFLVYYR